MSDEELKELVKTCNACEAGDPCFACGVNERLREIACARTEGKT